MKVFSNLRFLFMVAAASIMLVSCGEDLGDGGGGGSETQTSIDLQAGTDLVTSVTTIGIGETFVVNLVATAGDDALNTLEVFEDGVSISDFSRIKYNDDPAAANPVLLLEASKSMIDVNISVVAHTEVGTRTYRFTVADDAGDLESVSVDVTTVGTPPALTLNGPAVLDLQPGTTNQVNLTAIKGSGVIQSIGLAIDGVVENFPGLTFEDVECTTNPHLIGGTLGEGFDMAKLGFVTPTTPGSYVYTITVTDEFGLQSSTEFTLNVVSTPLDVYMGVLFNSLGPVGTGGLDLDNGESTGSADVNAEIRDQGVDANGTWKQLIAPVNDSKLYLMTPGQDGVSESFTFASIDSKETLAALNGSGLQISESGTVVSGQIYLAEREGVVYAFEIVEVNVIQADNSDNYVLNIVK